MPEAEGQIDGPAPGAVASVSCRHADAGEEASASKFVIGGVLRITRDEVRS